MLLDLTIFRATMTRRTVVGAVEARPRDFVVSPRIASQEAARPGSDAPRNATKA